MIFTSKTTLVDHPALQVVRVHGMDDSTFDPMTIYMVAQESADNYEEFVCRSFLDRNPSEVGVSFGATLEEAVENGIRWLRMNV